MTVKQKKNIVNIFKQYPLIKLGYLFGSHARSDTGPLSDYDIAVYADTNNARETADIKYTLESDISNVLGTDSVDVVMLNTNDSPEFKYQVIAEGELLYAEEPYKVLVEPKILNEFFDFRLMLRRYGLTKA